MAHLLSALMLIFMPTASNASGSLDESRPLDLGSFAFRPAGNPVETVRDVVVAAFRAGKWGVGYDLSEGEKPVLVNVNRLGIFLFGSKNPCPWIQSSWEWLRKETPFYNLDGVNPSSCIQDAFVNARPFPYGFVKLEKDFSYSKSIPSYRLFSARSNREFGSRISETKRASDQARSDRLLEVSIRRIDEHHLRELGRLIVHEGAHLFGQDALTMPLYGACSDPTDPNSKSCRNQLLVESQASHPGNAPDLANTIAFEVCTSAELVRCIFGDTCKSDQRIEVSEEKVPHKSRRQVVSSLLEQIVVSIEERTLGRSQTIESYWYLLEGVPTYLESSFLHSKGFLSMIESQCFRHKLTTRKMTDLHHMYVGAALIAGFKFCISTPGLVEKVASFSKEGVWSRSGKPWFSTLIGNVRETNCS